MKYSDIMANPTLKQLYYAWANMKKRCTNDKLHNSKYYVEKGITYSSDWETFTGFFCDMALSFKDGMLLDRINGDLGYSKDNCRWVSITDSNRNRSSVNLDLEKAAEIRKLYATGNYTQQDLGIMYGASRESIKDVLANKTWV